MKKFFIAIAALALVASAACTKVAPEEKKAEKISFKVANYVPQTKADGTNPYKSLIDEGITSFRSMAFLHAVGVTPVQDFFGANGETITANRTTNPSEWLPSHDYFWPKSADSYINFVSWYDKNEGNTGVAKANVTETTISWTNRTIATDDNIMWADEAWRYNQNTTSTSNNTNAGFTGEFKPFGQNSVTEGVPTLFHHALAKVSIKAKAEKVQGGANESNKTTWDVTLEDIKVTNTYNSGSLTLTNSDKGSMGIKAYETTGWVGTGTASGISMNNTEVLSTSLVDVLEEQSVLPQTLTDDAKLTFTLHIVTKYNGTKYSEEKIPVTVALNTLGTNPITAWAMNTKYTYNIIVNPETTVVKFDPAVIDWVEDTNAPTYTVPATL